MSTFTRLLRRAVTRRWEANRHISLLDDVDIGLVALGREYIANDHVIHALLERDGRDTDEIPDFAPLADRQAELVGLIAGTPARTGAGLLAKARCARIRSAERGFDAALELSLSLADDLLRSSDPLLCRSSLGRFCSSPDVTPLKTKEQIMNNLSDSDRLAIRRRNDLWRQAGNTLTTIGAFAVVALITLPANGIALTWLAVTALLATGTVALGLPFFLLRFIDHRA